MHLEHNGYSFDESMTQSQIEFILEEIEDTQLGIRQRVIDHAQDSNFSVLGIPESVSAQFTKNGYKYTPELTLEEIENLLFKFDENQFIEERNRQTERAPELSETEPLNFDIEILLGLKEPNGLDEESLDTWDFDLNKGIESTSIESSNPFLFDPYSISPTDSFKAPDLDLDLDLDSFSDKSQDQQSAAEIPQGEVTVQIPIEKLNENEEIKVKDNSFWARAKAKIAPIKDKITSKFETFKQESSSALNSFSSKLPKIQPLTFKTKNYSIEGTNTNDLAQSITAFRNKYAKRGKMSKFLDILSKDYTKKNWVKKGLTTLALNTLIGTCAVAAASATAAPAAATLTTVALLKSVISYKTKKLKNIRKLVETSDDRELKLQYQLLNFDPVLDEVKYLETLRELVSNYNFTNAYSMPDKIAEINKTACLSSLKSTATITALSLFAIPAITSIDFSESMDLVSSSFNALKDKVIGISENIASFHNFKPEISEIASQASDLTKEIEVKPQFTPHAVVSYNVEDVQIIDLQPEIKLSNLDAPINSEIHHNFRPGQELQVKTQDAGLGGRLKARSSDLKHVITKFKSGTKLIFTGAEKFASCDGQNFTFFEVTRAGKTFWVCKDYLT